MQFSFFLTAQLLLLLTRVFAHRIPDDPGDMSLLQEGPDDVFQPQSAQFANASLYSNTTSLSNSSLSYISLSKRAFGLPTDSLKWPDGKISYFFYQENINSKDLEKRGLIASYELLKMLSLVPIPDKACEVLSHLFSTVTADFSRQVGGIVQFKHISLEEGLWRVKNNASVLVIALIDKRIVMPGEFAASDIGMTAKRGLIGGSIVFSPFYLMEDVDVHLAVTDDDLLPGREKTAGYKLRHRQRTIMHELMHVVGAFHEHQRLDRDKYITLQQQDQIWSGNFQRLRIQKYCCDDVPYDFMSITHYPLENIAGATLRTDAPAIGRIESYYNRYKNRYSKHPNEVIGIEEFYQYIGRRCTLSEHDVSYVRGMYGNDVDSNHLDSIYSSTYILDKPVDIELNDMVSRFSDWTERVHDRTYKIKRIAGMMPAGPLQGPLSRIFKLGERIYHNFNEIRLHKPVFRWNLAEPLGPLVIKFTELANRILHRYGDPLVPFYVLPNVALSQSEVNAVLSEWMHLEDKWSRTFADIYQLL